MTCRCATRLMRWMRPYEITNCAWEMEFLELSDELMRDVNGELRKGKKVSIPYKSVRSHIDQLATGSQFNLKIHESAHNIDNVYNLLSARRAHESQTSIRYKLPLNDPMTYLWRQSSDRCDQQRGRCLVALAKYSYKVGSQFYPNAPVEMGPTKRSPCKMQSPRSILKEPFMSTPFERRRTDSESTSRCAISSSSTRSRPRATRTCKTDSI